MLLAMAIDSSKLPRRSESWALLVGVEMSKLSFALGRGDWPLEGALGLPVGELLLDLRLSCRVLAPLAWAPPDATSGLPSARVTFPGTAAGSLLLLAPLPTNAWPGTTEEITLSRCRPDAPEVEPAGAISVRGRPWALPTSSVSPWPTDMLSGLAWARELPLKPGGVSTPLLPIRVRYICSWSRCHSTISSGENRLSHMSCAAATALALGVAASSSPWPDGARDASDAGALRGGNLFPPLPSPIGPGCSIDLCCGLMLLGAGSFRYHVRSTVAGPGNPLEESQRCTRSCFSRKRAKGLSQRSAEITVICTCYNDNNDYYNDCYCHYVYVYT